MTAVMVLFFRRSESSDTEIENVRKQREVIFVLFLCAIQNHADLTVSIFAVFNQHKNKQPLYSRTLFLLRRFNVANVQISIQLSF